MVLASSQSVVFLATVKKLPQFNPMLPTLSIRRLLFYLAFYGMLVSFFVAYLSLVQYFTVKRDKPTLTGLFSILRLEPGLGFLPHQSFKHTLIHVRTNQPASFRGLTDQMSAFLATYLTHYRGGKLDDCSNDYLPPDLKARARRSCPFDISAGGPCNINDGFGFHRGEPCVILKLNRIYGWLPSLPENDTSKGVSVKCSGRSDVDAEFLGPICYYDLQWWQDFNRVKARNGSRLSMRSMAACSKPDHGTLDSMFFPYINSARFHNPLVFVRFPRVKRHVIVRVQCWALANNILVDFAHRQGSVTFELLID